MLLRRIAEAFRARNWSIAALEIVIVVVGIFLALQVDSWNEERKDRIDESEYVARLHDELLMAEQLSGRVRERRLSYGDLINRAGDKIFFRDRSATLTVEECYATAATIYFNIPVAGLPALEELISTGRIAIIRNTELRSALVGLRPVTDTLEFIILVQNARAIDLPSQYPQLIKLKHVISDDNGEAVAEPTCDLAAMRENQPFANDFTANADRYDAYIRDALMPWSAQVDKLHVLLDAELGIRHD